MASQVNTQVDWTVGRCNRLMRPLVTRIQKLRILKEEKEIAKRPTVPTTGNVTASKTKGLDSSDDSSEDTSIKPSKDNDPDWMTVPKKKKTSKGYSARNNSVKDAATEIGVRTPARSKMHANLRPGELSIPTPYLTRNLTSTSEIDYTSSSSLPPTTSNGVNNRKQQGRFDKCASDLLEYRKKAFFANGEDERAVASNVVKTFVDILYATNESPDPGEQKRSSPSCGTRSLWATCCAKFGTAIAKVEADPDPEEDGLLDAGAEYYAMAEGLELPERKRGGRLQLRLIVRAHATHVMGTAVDEGLIPWNVLKQYLPHMFRPTELSGQPSAAIEGEILLAKSHVFVTSATHGVTCPGKHRNHFYTHILNSAMSQVAYVGEDQRLALGFRQLTLLLRHPEFPVEWLASRRILPLWRDVFRTLLDSKSPQNIQDAYKLLRQTVSLAVGLEPSPSAADKVLSEIPADFVHMTVRCPKCPRAQFGTFLVDTSPTAQRPAANDMKLSKSQLTDALSNTLSSMSTMLSSFAIAYLTNAADLANVNAQVILSVLNLLSLEIVQHHAAKVTATTDVKRSKIVARRAVSVLAATVVPQIAGCQFTNGSTFVSVDQLVQQMKTLDSENRNSSADPTTILDGLPDLICSIARGASQVLEADAFNTLRSLVHSLASPNVAEQNISPSTALFLKQLAFSSAHRFAEISKDSAHYSLIDEIEKEIGQIEHFDLSKTPFRSSTKVQTESRGFKWEEGICEWVLASPKPPKPEADTPKKASKYLDLFKKTEKDDSSDDDLPGMWDTEIDDSNVNYLCDLINSSSPISGGLPTKFGKNNLILPQMRKENERVKNIKVTQLKLPMLKRAAFIDSDNSDDELSFHGPQSRKRPSSSDLRSSSSGPAKFQSRSKLPRNAKKDDSEDELGF